MLSVIFLVKQPKEKDWIHQPDSDEFGTAAGSRCPILIEIQTEVLLLVLYNNNESCIYFKQVDHLHKMDGYRAEDSAMN
jgi:hypothetical protein